MWILGHLTLGYFSAIFVSRYTKERIIILVVWFLSLTPDLDEFLTRFIVHRGPSHSILVVVLLFIPILIFFRRGWGYLATITSHILIGDYFVPPVQLFWPVASTWFSAPVELHFIERFETVVEISLFTAMMVLIAHRRRFFII